MALQMAWRPGPARLPAWLARRPVPRQLLVHVVRRGVPVVRRIERWTRPRLRGLATGIGATAGYLVIVFLGLLVTLPIPFGNGLPGVAIVVLTLGLARSDGLVVAVGHAIALVATTISAGFVAAGIAALQWAL
jgi:hypothetical protein